MLNYGFFRNVIDQASYEFSQDKLPRKVLQPTGSWGEFLPTYEPQFGGDWDTDGCTLWGTQNAIEILDRRIFGESSNYAERFNYNLIPIHPPGSDPDLVAENIRHFGMIPNTELPMTISYEEFLTPDPMTPELLAEGKGWLAKREFKHEWLWKSEPSLEVKRRIMKEALLYSPVGVSVSAWQKNDQGLFVDMGRPNNHWCVCFGFDGDNPLIFDSYDQSVKTLSADHRIERAKSFYLGTPVISFWGKLLALFVK